MSLPYNINNEEYRDMTIKSIYPFADNASLTNGIIAIPSQAFLDILVYAVGSFEAPFYISAVDGLQGSDDEALLTISDFNGEAVGTAWLDKTADMCYIKQGGTVQAGVIVYDQTAMIRFLGELGRARTVFTPIQTPIAAGQCFAVFPSDITAIKGQKKTYTGDVDIWADQGATFTLSVDDEVEINLYGESTVHPIAILTINGLSFPGGHVWLAAHPDSALRVIANTGEVQVAHKRDLTYGQ